MMIYVIAAAEDCDVTFPVTVFPDAVRSHWGDAVTSVGWDFNGGLVAGIHPTDAPGYSIRMNRDGSSISPDGTPDQIADVALWALTLLPKDHERVVLYDANGSRELRDGMSHAEVWSSWQDF